MGIVGFVIFLLFFISIVKISYKNCKKMNNGKNLVYSMITFSFVLFFLLYGMTGNPIYDGFTLMFFSLFLAICYRGKMEDKKNE